MGDFKRHQLHLIQTQQRCFTEDAQALKDEVAAQQAEWSEAMERREQAAMEQEVMLSARGLEAEEQRERMKRETVWKSTTGLGGPHQTSELSISIKSKSIRLIFGRIDCSRRVLEAQRKSLVQFIRLRAH